MELDREVKRMNKEIREKIAQYLGDVYEQGIILKHLSVRLEIADQILAIIRKATQKNNHERSPQ